MFKGGGFGLLGELFSFPGSLSCTQEVCEVLVAQSCLMLYDLMDCSLPDTSVHGIFQVDLPNQGIKPISLALSDGFFITGTTINSPQYMSNFLS